MANHRCFNMKLTTNSDAFHELSDKARLLYFDIMGSADDEGFLANIKSVVRYNNRATMKHVEELVGKGYLIKFDTGVYCVKHWWIHNSKHAMKITPTVYQAELSMLIADADKAYNVITSEQNAKEESFNNGLDRVSNGEEKVTNTIQVNCEANSSKANLSQPKANPTKGNQTVIARPQAGYDQREDNNIYNNNIYISDADNLSDEGLPFGANPLNQLL